MEQENSPVTTCAKFQVSRTEMAQPIQTASQLGCQVQRTEERGHKGYRGGGLAPETNSEETHVCSYIHTPNKRALHYLTELYTI